VLELVLVLGVSVRVVEVGGAGGATGVEVVGGAAGVDVVVPGAVLGAAVDTSQPGVSPNDVPPTQLTHPG
jgi:hypothetical protein